MDRNEKNVVTWTAMISAYRTRGKEKEALRLFDKMISDGIVPDSNIYAIVLTICADIGCLETGQKIHGMISGSLLKDVYIKNTLVNMYGKCGSLDEAIKIFNIMGKNEKNVVAWAAMISAYGLHGKGIEALALFEEMRNDGIQPDSNTYNIVLTICADIGALDVGKKIHNMAPQSLLQDVFVKTALINMFSKCGT